MGTVRIASFLDMHKQLSQQHYMMAMSLNQPLNHQMLKAWLKKT